MCIIPMHILPVTLSILSSDTWRGRKGETLRTSVKEFLPHGLEGWGMEATQEETIKAHLIKSGMFCSVT